MNSQDYIDVLEVNLLPYLQSLPQHQLTLQKDNASIHVNQATKSWLQSKEVPLLDWPACSPDLNPIENLWGMLARRVYGNSTQYANVQALKDAITREWNAIPRSTIKKLVNSMLSRIFNVISLQGQTTKY
ncbi:unnamed protein product, partial [Mesorhabditis belari]|uniref:Tc1-like transposase DDE domain-containing protein n=1 Tax=Mesorhabditis belari TaxID=2138241 RepID=A0AAF3FQ78_9BILA